MDSCYVFVGFLAIFLVADMEYKILEGFSLRLSNFSPQDSCLSSPGLNVFYFASVFSSFSQAFSLVLESLKVVGPEAFVSFHSSSWDASLSTVYIATINDFADFIWML